MATSRLRTRTGITSPEVISWISCRHSSTLDSLPATTDVMRNTLAIPNAAALPVPNLPRPARPARRSRFSPCMTKKFRSPAQSIPLPLSRITMRLLAVSSDTNTLGLTPGSTYCKPLTTYSHITSRSLLKVAAVCSKSRATWLRTTNESSLMLMIHFVSSRAARSRSASPSSESSGNALSNRLTFRVRALPFM